MKLPVVSCAEMRRIEEATFAAGVTAESLMEEVGRQIARSIALHGLGSRGWRLCFTARVTTEGTRLVAARYLKRAGWEIDLRPQEAEISKLAQLTKEQLIQLQIVHAEERNSAHLDPRDVVIIDGLLGIGANGPLRDEIRALTREINALRLEKNARVIAVDLPTGLNGDTGEADRDCVVADVTVTAGYAKTGLVADAAAQYVGRLCVATLPEFAPHAPADFQGETATTESLHGLLPRRNFDSYKTQYGRVGIIAGSPGFTGAAVLCASGALRGGAGLVTVYAPEDIQPILAIKMPPEIMVHPVKSYAEVLDEKLDVLAVGHGLGQERAGAILQLIEHFAGPMVLDADGLNIVAEHDAGILNRCAGPRLLTPHPGEMARLFPESKGLTRSETATQFTAQHPVTLLLKGSRTIIHEHGKPASYNTTGNPGMGTGGMGDVLTGVCAALIGQHLSPYDAARVGAWLCGNAAELAVTAASSEECLSATDVIAHLGRACDRLHAVRL